MQEEKFNFDEYQYLQLVEEVIKEGVEKQDRTGTGTKSKFGDQIKFDLTDNKFPLLTTKKVFVRGIFEELMWFIRGQTDSTILEKKGVNIWKGNTSREFLDNKGLKHLPVGDIGAGYGFQWRYFGAKYVDCKTDYKGQGFDQIAYVINEIKNNPNSRRIVLSGWNPPEINNAVLPPVKIKKKIILIPF